MEKALNFRAFSFLVRIYALEMDVIGLLIPESAPMRRVADFFLDPLQGSYRSDDDSG
jgi:hypothetical protein